MGEVLAHLGDTQQSAGDSGAARDSWQRALAIFDQLGLPDADQIRARLRRLDRSATGDVDREPQRPAAPPVRPGAPRAAAAASS
jgi:hypothetical protein